MTSILGLDLGTRTGWAVAVGGELLESGVQAFDLRRGESPGMRFIRFRRWLAYMLSAPEGSVPPWPRIELVVYEAAHHRGGAATEVGVGLATRVIELGAEFGAEHASVHSASLKRHMTGSGNCSKDAMIAAAQERWGTADIGEDEADALCVLAWAVDEFGDGTKG